MSETPITLGGAIAFMRQMRRAPVWDRTQRRAINTFLALHVNYVVKTEDRFVANRIMEAIGTDRFLEVLDKVLETLSPSTRH